jgi:hypothetical protein
MDLGTVPALGGPPALIVSAFFFLFGFLDLDLALALAFDIFAICDQPRSLTDHSSSFAKARGLLSPTSVWPMLPDSVVFSLDAPAVDVRAASLWTRLGSPSSWCAKRTSERRHEEGVGAEQMSDDNHRSWCIRRRRTNDGPTSPRSSN